MLRKKEIWCTNVAGASQILNRHRSTVSTYLRDGELGCFKYGRNTLIPMMEIAKFMEVPENRVVGAAKSLELPLWRCKR